MGGGGQDNQALSLLGDKYEATCFSQETNMNILFLVVFFSLPLSKRGSLLVLLVEPSHWVEPKFCAEVSVQVCALLLNGDLWHKLQKLCDGGDGKKYFSSCSWLETSKEKVPLDI